MLTTSNKSCGDELDLFALYQFARRSNILLCYSNLWRVTKTVGPDDAHFFYSQWEVNF